jgi:hypothetical protein
MDYYIAEKNKPSPSIFICAITEKRRKKKHWLGTYHGHNVKPFGYDLQPCMPTTEALIN